ncbi:MAG: hypothetical protein QOH56_385 [Pseudonocardiales bacterium]|jgi:hypothetical protein|nr:hypothetical protein [Pseudonocardiales bacterium]
MRDELNTLLQKEMDRRGFLKVAGAGLLAVLGITAVIHALSGSHASPRDNADVALTTYGHSLPPRARR